MKERLSQPLIFVLLCMLYGLSEELFNCQFYELFLSICTGKNLLTQTNTCYPAQAVTVCAASSAETTFLWLFPAVAKSAEWGLCCFGAGSVSSATEDERLGVVAALNPEVDYHSVGVDPEALSWLPLQMVRELRCRSEYPKACSSWS